MAVTCWHGGAQKREATFQVNNLRALRRVCEEGGGVAVLPDYIVEDRHKLIQIMTDVEEVPEFDTYFCYPAEMRSSAKLKCSVTF